MKMNGIEKYAEQILKDSGCDIYTYGGESSNYIMDDLKSAYPDGMEYPYIDVANAILKMSRPALIKRSPFKVDWDNDDCCDSFDAESFESAKASAEDVLVRWLAYQANGADINEWTADQIEEWDYMIENYYVSVSKYNPHTDEYEEYWTPSYEECVRVGWMTYDELKERIAT